MTTHRKKRGSWTYRECRFGSDLLRPEVAEDLRARQTEERRLAEEGEDRETAEMSAEIESHPFRHGMVGHGCT